MFPRPRLLALTLVGLLLLAALPPAESQGRRVSFDAVRFDDTLFTSIDTAYRVGFDDAGDVWYTTQAGLVYVDPETPARQVYTAADGLPSSYAMGLALGGGKAYVATDLGLGIVDRATGEVRAVTTQNSPLPDDVVREVALIGSDLWIGTHFGGLAVWNLTTDEWVAKNTSTNADYPSAIYRIVPTVDSVWVTTEKNGAWRHQPAKGGVADAASWSVVLSADGLGTNNVLSVAQRNQDVWFGTDKGLVAWRPYAPHAGTASEWRHFNRTHGMPDDRVFDVDLIPTETGMFDVFASTREGVWQYEVTTGQSTTRAQSFGILGSYVLDNTFDAARGWAFASSRGVSLLRDGEWTYFTTGPSEGASPGPSAFLFTAAGVGESPYLWFGSGNSVSAFDPSARGGRGTWYNLAEWQNFPGATVNHIDSDGAWTWIATNNGAWGFNTETLRWASKQAASPSRNLVYGLEADRGELWIALFGEGLLMQNLTTGVSRSWDAQSLTPIPDVHLTDVRAQGNDIWLGSGSGVLRLDRTSGSFTGTYTAADGVPGTGVVFRVLPDGTNVWLGTKDGGIGRLNVATGKVDRVWSAAEHEGFPTGEVRSLHREGGRLWAGFACPPSGDMPEGCGGLVRIDLSTGAWKAYRQGSSELVQNTVGGITSRDGILYLATLSGVARLDIVADRFLPLSADVNSPIPGTGGAGSATRPFVRIDTPRDGRAVTGEIEIAGIATHFAGDAIDRVEVRIGAGDWQPATGTTEWTFPWDTRPLPRNEAVTIAARAISGNQTSREAEIVVTVVEVPTTPLALEHEPAANGTAGRPIPLRAVATGDDPLTVTAFYKRSDQSTYTRVTLQRQGALFTGAIPAKDVREGELRYYLDARSGLLSTTDPANPEEPHVVTVGPPARLAVDVEAPTAVDAQAGRTTRFELHVTNTGTDAASFVVSASGLRAAWITLDSAPIALQPGETRAVPVTIAVPAAAFSDETTMSFQVVDTTGGAEPSVATFPLRVTGAAAPDVTATGQEAKRGFLGIPGPAPLFVMLALLGAAVLARRRSS